MNYPKVFLLILFSFLIGLTAMAKPFFANAKKEIMTEKQADSSPCPDSDNDCPSDEESNESGEDSEGGDEFESLPYLILQIPFLGKTLIKFSYLMLNPEHFASICIPPPENP